MSSKYAHLDRRRFRIEEIQSGGFRIGRRVPLPYGPIRQVRRPPTSRLTYLNPGMRGYQQLVHHRFGAPLVPFDVRRSAAPAGALNAVRLARLEARLRAGRRSPVTMRYGYGARLPVRDRSLLRERFRQTRRVNMRLTFNSPLPSRPRRGGGKGL